MENNKIMDKQDCGGGRWKNGKDREDGKGKQAGRGKEGGKDQ